MASSTLLHPLSSYESNPKDNVSVTLAYVIETNKPYEETKLALQTAIAKATDRWRLLAGRLEFHPEMGTRGRWCILIPLGDLPPSYETHTFTSTDSPTPLSVPLPTLLPSTASLLTKPALTHFRHSNTLAANVLCAKADAPILSFHLSNLGEGKVGMGISIPHGVFDGEGMGAIVKGVSAELNGEEWDPPAWGEVNPLTTFLERTGEEEEKDGTSSLKKVSASDAGSIVVEHPEEPAPIPHVQPMRDYTPSSLFALLRFVWRYAVEVLWHRAVPRTIFLGRDVVKTLVEKVKAEVKEMTGGKEWVSEGDIMVGWLMKATYSQSSRRNKNLHVSPVFSLRALSPTLTTYPHNANLSFPLPILPISEVASPRISIATLALAHRRCLNAARNKSYVQRSLEWIADAGGFWVPCRKSGKESWLFTNQVSGGLPDLRVPGGKVVAFWTWFFPLVPPHCASLNKLDGGCLLGAVLRASQWKAIQAELDRLKKDI